MVHIHDVGVIYRKMKKKATIAVIIILALWFTGNLGLYLCIKYSLTPEIKRAIDYIPTKLMLKEADIESGTFYFKGFKMKFPFYKKDISHVNPMYIEHKLDNINLTSSNFEEYGHILFHVIPDRLDYPKSSLMQRAWDKIQLKDTSFFELIKSAHYAKLTDYSWWNLIHNIRLSNLLILKAISWSQSNNFEAFDVETQHVTGILKINTYDIAGEQTKDPNRVNVSFDFRFQDKKYNIAFISVHRNNVDKIQKIISSIRPINNIQTSYKELKALFENSESSKYPRELILISMFSLKKPTLQDMEKLLIIMEDKKYRQFIIDSVKKEIKYLKDNKITHSNT